MYFIFHFVIEFQFRSRLYRLTNRRHQDNVIDAMHCGNALISLIPLGIGKAGVALTPTGVVLTVAVITCVVVLLMMRKCVMGFTPVKGSSVSIQFSRWHPKQLVAHPFGV